jgi:hypothetical protein
MPGAQDISIGNDLTISYAMAPAEYIFCASTGNLGDLTHTMCEGSDPKNACVEIKNFKLMARRCFFLGRVLETGKKATEHFATFKFGRVRYASLSVKAGAAMEVPSPFTKDIAFVSQQEIRIVLIPMSGEALPSVVTIEVPKLSPLLREVFRNREIKARAPPNT